MTKCLRKRGLMIVISSPSGAGKSSLANALIAKDDNLCFSISATTRSMRPQEIDGTHYFFKTDEEFEKLISEDAFLEYANIFGNRYGTLVDQVELLLNKKKDIIFDIDWQGARALKHRMPNDVITIYILPPSIQALKQRLELRSQDSKETIETRMKEAEAECAHYIEYDYVIINDHFEDSLEKLQSIVKAERIKCHRQENLTDFVKSL